MQARESVDFFRGASGIRGDECGMLPRASRLFGVVWIQQGLLVLSRFVALFNDDALGRRQADAETRAAARFRGNSQARLLPAGHKILALALGINTSRSRTVKQI